MIRNYAGEVETKATENNNLTEAVKSWITWAKKSADWYDPTFPKGKDELLAGVDIENLRVQNDFYYYEQKERNFWKPWWSK